MDELSYLRQAIKDECFVAGNKTQTGANFCRWVLSNLYDLTPDEAYDAQCGGSDDAGIDAFFYRHETFYLVQTKYSSDDAWADVNRLKTDGTLVLSRKLNDKEKTRLKTLLESYDQFSNATIGHAVRMVYVTGSEITETTKKKIAQLGTGDGLTAIGLSDLNSALQDKVRSVSPKWKGHRVDINILAHFKHGETAVCAIPVNEIAKLAIEASDYLFASNVRDFLKSTSINRKMVDTLKTQPLHFWDYNNGITLVCDSFEIVSKTLTVKTPQVVNGCQTVTTIRNVGASEGKDALDKATLLVRVIPAGQDDRRREITRYTNAQNAVRGKDLYSLEDYQRRIKREMKKYGYFYEIQRGSAAQMQPKERQSFKGTPELEHLVPPKWGHVIPAIEAVQAYAACAMMKPEIAYARSEDLTPLGQYYDELFPTDADLNVRMFLLPYLVVSYARNQLHYGRSAAGFRKSAQFLFATVFNLLVARDSGFSAQAVEGGNVSVSADAYWAILTDKASSIKMLETADQVLEAFFDDGKVEEIIETEFDNDIKNMMKRKLPGSLWYSLLIKKTEKAIAKLGK